MEVACRFVGQWERQVRVGLFRGMDSDRKMKYNRVIWGKFAKAGSEI
jgi:hypothetical protein